MTAERTRRLRSLSTPGAPPSHVTFGPHPAQNYPVILQIFRLGSRLAPIRSRSSGHAQPNWSNPIRLTSRYHRKRGITIGSGECAQRSITGQWQSRWLSGAGFRTDMRRIRPIPPIRVAQRPRSGPCPLGRAVRNIIRRTIALTKGSVQANRPRVRSWSLHIRSVRGTISGRRRAVIGRLRLRTQRAER